MEVKISMDSESEGSTNLHLHSQTHASIHSWRWWHCTCALLLLPFSSVFHLPFLPVLWQCRHQGPLVSAGSIRGRKILLNTLSASRTTILSLWLSPDTVSIRNLTRKLCNQKDSQRHLITQVFIQIRWKLSRWFQETTLKGDVSHFTSFSRTSDTFVETNLTSVREPIEDDEERLAMKIGDTPPPLPRRVSNPRIRDDQALN